MKKLMLALACFMPLTVSADDHAPMPPAIAVVYECTLNEGVAAADLVATTHAQAKRQSAAAGASCVEAHMVMSTEEK